MPARIASKRPRSARVWSLASAELIQRASPLRVAIRPSRLAANFAVTSGRPVNLWVRNAARPRAAGSAPSPVVTWMPAARRRAMPRPLTLASGSGRAQWTAAIPAAINASAQGGVRPQWLQGSSVTKTSAPRAASAAWASATASACGPPGGRVKPRPATRLSRTITQPTAGLGLTGPASAASSIARAIQGEVASVTSSV
jgi:hypothetical protein